MSLDSDVAAASLEAPPFPDLGDSALMLDIDGTLIDIAARPDEVVVPASLRETLQLLQSSLNGAVALVSGRQLADIDRLFSPLKFSAVGGHGAECRQLPLGPIDTTHATPLPKDLSQALFQFADGRDGVIVEDKGYSLALHYRLAPQHEAAILKGVSALCAGWPMIGILPGKAVVEIKQTGANKGTGIRKLMQALPFSGRRPIFIGDDVTDEFAAAAVPEFGGFAMSVGRAMPGAVYRFESPTAVRNWLGKLSTGHG